MKAAEKSSYNQCLVLVHQFPSSIVSSDFRDYSWLRLGLGLGVGI